ncbi:hypothetical protein ACELLULO517_04545 [Acidisoma cellulosilytica]|uniref:Lipoprotein n=1 Tax=Acidisoma cellulosilyticum TaxID=2802395 RepID=A0A963YYY9_9PROT|nr:hypothetical protein [Acidisoma cellulosilyticum]MCB8879491.1 hypothetical protein [Acidisoma cellulosilyticum]
MNRTWTFATLVLGLPLGLGGCDMMGPTKAPPLGAVPAASGSINPISAQVQTGAGTQSGPSVGPEGGATQAGIGTGNAVGSGAGPSLNPPGTAP